MSLSSSQLDAFAEVAKTGSFSEAARRLHVTQSALSQRILNLEQEISASLIIREASGLRLTAAGEELLQFHKARTHLEHEALSRISGNTSEFSGVIRLGCFSSVARSVVLPSISGLILKNPNLPVEIITRELHELPSLLARNETDFIFTNFDPQKQDVETLAVGYEENVLIDRNPTASNRDVYFDHDVNDQTTKTFFKLQKSQPKSMRIAYLDEIYSIIDAVALGWGRAVVPRHLIKHNKSVRVLTGFKSLKSPVYICYYKQSYYSKLHQAIMTEIKNNIASHLANI